MKYNWLFIIVVFSFLSCGKKYERSGRKVEIVEENGRYIVLKEGKPFYIKGAGGYEHYEKVREYGGNSVRVWDHFNAGEILDKAQENGLMVTLGLEIGKEINGFDYSNEKEVQRQFEDIKKVVYRYKDHPALLFWAVGNEVDQFGSNDKVWDAVNEIAAMIHEVDPDHPVTTTIVPERMKIMKIKYLCPEIDFLSFNTFYHLPELSKKLREFIWGWDKPYLVSEWGSQGWWEANKSIWGASYENTSTFKATTLKRFYNYIKEDKNCIGSYVFYWGAKQEKTPTWFSMFTFDGKPTEQVEVMKYLWKDQPAEFEYPRITEVLINESPSTKNLTLKKGADCKLSVKTNFSPDSLDFAYEFRKEAPDFPMSWELDQLPELINPKNVKVVNGELEFKAPDERGAYRIYFFISDKTGRTSFGNLPFFIE